MRFFSSERNKFAFDYFSFLLKFFLDIRNFYKLSAIFIQTLKSWKDKIYLGFFSTP